MQRMGIFLAFAILLAGCGPGSGSIEVSGTVVAGPVCPVQRQPPDPACADRAVPGATLLVQDASGAEVQRVTSDAGGRFTLRLRAGSFRIVPQPISSMPGTPPPVELNVRPGEVPKLITITYDTGIR